MGDPNVVNDRAGTSKSMGGVVSDGASTSKAQRGQKQEKKEEVSNQASSPPKGLVKTGAYGASKPKALPKPILKKGSSNIPSGSGTRSTPPKEIGALKKAASKTKTRYEDKEFVTLYINCKRGICNCINNESNPSSLDSLPRVTRTITKRNRSRPSREGKEYLAIYMNPTKHQSAPVADVQEYIEENGVTTTTKEKVYIGSASDESWDELAIITAPRSLAETKGKLKTTCVQKQPSGSDSNQLELDDDDRGSFTSTVVYTTPSDADFELDDEQDEALLPASRKQGAPAYELVRGSSYDVTALRTFSLDSYKGPVGTSEEHFNARVPVLKTTGKDRFSAYPEDVHRMVLERYKKHVAEYAKTAQDRETTPPRGTSGTGTGNGGGAAAAQAHKFPSRPADFPSRRHILQPGGCYSLARYSRGVMTSGPVGHHGVGGSGSMTRSLGSFGSPVGRAGAVTPPPPATAMPPRPKKKEAKATEEEDPHFQVDAYFVPRPSTDADAGADAATRASSEQDDTDTDKGAAIPPSSSRGSKKEQKDKE